MQADRKAFATAAKPDDATPAAQTRADAHRERFRKAQAVAAQIARARAAGGQPSEAEAARLVEEFHARGGQVTVCPAPEVPLADEQDRRKAAGRVRN